MKKLNQEDFGMELISDLGTDEKYIRYGLFRCSACGKKFKVHVSNARRNKQKHCIDCSRSITVTMRNTIHGQAKTRLNNIFHGMKNRCYNKKSSKYKMYGAAGIIVCNEWINNYENFAKWARNNGYTDNLTIDRIDGSKGYSPNNCRWTSGNIQAQNTKVIMSTNSSGYRGVKRSCGKYRATINHNNTRHHLGVFDNKVDAAIAYNKYVIENKTAHPTNF